MPCTCATACADFKSAAYFFASRCQPSSCPCQPLYSCCPAFAAQQVLLVLLERGDGALQLLDLGIARITALAPLPYGVSVAERGFNLNGGF
eukprot:6209554-Pleurochrysis_carterae.AAC.1